MHSYREIHRSALNLFNMRATPTGPCLRRVSRDYTAGGIPQLHVFLP